MKDLMFILPYQAGTLAQLTGALSEAGVNLQGCSGQQFGPEGIIHLLVENAAEAREAAARAGFVVRGEHEVIVADIEDRPGARSPPSRPPGWSWSPWPPWSGRWSAPG
jgi:hypothetical protein